MTGLRKAIVAALVALAGFGAATGAEDLRLRPLQTLQGDAQGARLRLPEGVACSESMFVAADTGNGRLVRYPLEGGDIKPGSPIVLSQVPYPTRVAVTSKGEILALDGKLRKLARLSAGGEFQAYIEPVGRATPSSWAPVAFKVGAGDALWVLDIVSGRVVSMEITGQVKREIALPADSGHVADIAVAPTGAVFALDSVARRLSVAKPDAAAFEALTESLPDLMDFPVGLALDGKGRLFVADKDGGEIIVFGPDGTFRGRPSTTGWKEGLVRYPTQLCVDGRNRLFVADRANNRIQVFLIPQ